MVATQIELNQKETAKDKLEVIKYHILAIQLEISSYLAGSSIESLPCTHSYSEMLEQIRARSDKTATHSKNVAFMSYEIGCILGLDPRAIAELFVAGHLHDLGKTSNATILEIVERNGLITHNEKEIVSQHATLGFETLVESGLHRGSESLQRIALLTYLHHSLFVWNNPHLPIEQQTRPYPDQDTFNARLANVDDVYGSQFVTLLQQDSFRFMLEVIAASDSTEAALSRTYNGSKNIADIIAELQVMKESGIFRVAVIDACINLLYSVEKDPLLFKKMACCP